MLGSMTDDDARLLVNEQVQWAHSYDGYRRLAGTPEALDRLIEPAREEWRRTGCVPDWCGVDFLRGWAFYTARADRHGGGYGLDPSGYLVQEWNAVLGALATHPAAIGVDLPPTVPRPGRPALRLSTAPRANANPDEVAAKAARLREPHIAPISDLVLELAAEHPSGVPYVDPDSGGVTARVLLLLEAPARAAAHGSGMLSADNDDGTAANVWRAYQASGLSRIEAVHWNAVPWYVGSETALAPPTPSDITNGRRALVRLVALLPDLRVVIVMGSSARDAIEPMRADLTSRGLVLLTSDHPSQRRYNLTQGRAEASVVAAFAEAKRVLALEVDRDA